MVDLSLILPVYQQEDIITDVYKDIFQAVKNLKTSFEIILVENGSTDKTLEKVKNITQKYPHTRYSTTTKGYGSAIITGLKLAKGEYLCYMPSDGQIDLAILPELWKLAKTNEFEIVKVKRINRESPLRVLTSRFLSVVLSLKHHTPLIDINGSPRILTCRNMLVLKLSYKDSFIDAEMTVKAKKRGWKIKEIPMENLPRYGGKSSRSWKTYFEFIKNVIIYN